jgi:hypothetical protein
MGGERRKKNRMKNKMKKIKRCPRCRKTTLVDIDSGGRQQINPFTLREFQGQLCTSCNWSEKTYVFTDITIPEEGK